eukprot:c26416_g1_i4 orf=815-1564(-)
MDLDSPDGRVPMPMPFSSCYAPLPEEDKLPIFSSGNGVAVEEVPIPEAKPKEVVVYRECLKNHAVSIGGYALDGCGEFMPNGEEGTVEALKCAACSCHRNFHRREVEGEHLCDCKNMRNDRKRLAPLGPATPALFSLPAPRDIPSSHPQMVMAFSSTPTDSDDGDAAHVHSAHSMKKRFRTKFTAEQKEQMHAFAEKLGWRIQKHNETAVQEFCNNAGVKRNVLKVWMHNNKQITEKKNGKWICYDHKE